MKENAPELVALDLKSTWAVRPPKTEFVLPGLARGTVGNVVATGGTGKTFVMLETALGVGIGKDVGDIWGCEDVIRGPVVFLSVEDPETELKQRLWAIGKLLSKQEQEAAREFVHILAGAGRGLTLAEVPSKAGKGHELKVTPWFQAFSRSIISLRPRLVVIDTLNRFLGGVSENDGSAMGWVISRIEELARLADCAIVLCHHVSKAALGSGNAGAAHAARGSSVITDNARWQVNLSVPSTDGEFKKLFRDMNDGERRRFVRLDLPSSTMGRKGRGVGCIAPRTRPVCSGSGN